MFVKGLALGLALVLLAAAPGAASAPPQDPPRVTANAALLMDARTGAVLYEKRAFQKLPMASTTKVMTAILALEKGKLGDPVTVSRRAAATPGSTMNLRTGDRYTLEQLIYGLLLNSGNDAAVAIAEHISGTEAQFVKLMNEKAVEIGAVSTRFENSHGLDEPDHYTTAYDLAIITRYAMRDPFFARIVKMKEKQVETGNRRDRQTLINTNGLLWSYEHAEGVKTGWTGKAGRCITAAATRNGQRLLVVILDSDNRNQEAINLFEYGFSRFKLLVLAREGEVLAARPVRRGRSGRVELVAGEELSVTVPVEESQGISLRIEAPPFLTAPIYQLEPVGYAYAVRDGRVIAQAPLVAAASVRKRTILVDAGDLFLRAFRWFLAPGSLQ